MLSLRLPAEAENRLAAVAKANGCTKTHYVRELILEHLEDLEDLYLAQQRMADIRAGRSRTYSQEEVERALGIHEDAAHVPNKLTAETLAKSERGENVHHAKDAEDLFKRLDLDSRKARLQALLDMEPCPDFEPRPRPRYTLDALLAQCDETADFPEEDRQWLNCAPVGKELL